jgi:guanylate kinase
VVENVKKEYPRLLALKIYADKQPGSPVIVGDVDAAQLGQPGSQNEEDVIQRGSIYYLPTRHWVEVTMPLRDRNGEVTAAMKTRMDTFRGETRDTSVARALIVKKAVEKRMSAFQDIGQ